MNKGLTFSLANQLRTRLEVNSEPLTDMHWHSSLNKQIGQYCAASEVIGASRDKQKLGYGVAGNLVANGYDGYQ